MANMANQKFKAGDRVRYYGTMLPMLVGCDLIVTMAHVKSGFGDPATDDVCMVDHPHRYGKNFRVSSCHLARVA